MLACRRPAHAIAPRDWDAGLGKTTRVAIPAGTVLQWDQLHG